jgi:hypothetical protein
MVGHFPIVGNIVIGCPVNSTVTAQYCSRIVPMEDWRTIARVLMSNLGWRSMTTLALIGFAARPRSAGTVRLMVREQEGFW